MEVCIRAATLADLREHQETWRPALRLLGAQDAEWEWLQDFERDELPVATRETYALVEHSPSKLLGLVSLDFRSDHLYVERLAIAPQLRTVPAPIKGVGTALMIAGFRRALSSGKGWIRLHSLEDENTLRFYRRLNMVEVGVDPIDGQKMRRFEISAAEAQLFTRG
ncbi:MAG: GNAT family N-acetyltransferase [Myxococcota bacterium]